MEAQGMIEIVARAMFSPDWPKDDWDRFGPRDNATERYRAMARAAIKAIRTPSQAMMDAGDGCCGEYGCGYYRMEQIFSAMIDAALNEQEKG